MTHSLGVAGFPGRSIRAAASHGRAETEEFTGGARVSASKCAYATPNAWNSYGLSCKVLVRHDLRVMRDVHPWHPAFMHLGVKEIAALLGIHPRTALKLMSSGTIPAYRLGPKLWRISRAAYDDWVAQQEMAGRSRTAA